MSAQCYSIEQWVKTLHDLMYNDSNHRWFTGEKVGHDPKPEELAANWFESGAHKRTVAHLREQS